MQKDTKGIIDIVRDICNVNTVCGYESLENSKIAEYFKSYSLVKTDQNSNIIAEMGKADGDFHVMLEAHLDHIGFIVTDIDKEGFIKFASCGGVDKRILPSTQVVIFGTEPVFGVIGCATPHLIGSKTDVLDINDMFIDTGLTKPEVEELLSIGDRIIYDTDAITLNNNRIVSKSLDNRCGIAVLLLCAKELANLKLNYKLSMVLSVQEEFSGLGAKTKAFEYEPDEAIVVDVSFADQKKLSIDSKGKLNGGTMIGISPILDNQITNELKQIASQNNINHCFEVMGGKTGTNADSISISKSGVKTALLSVPIRYMHTPTEMADIRDIEATAKLIVGYLLKKNEV